MKSYPQKERELMRQPVVQSKVSLLRKVKCPFCKSKMAKENLEKYGKCYTCHMNNQME
jgi:hypothetical protein